MDSEKYETTKNEFEKIQCCEKRLQLEDGRISLVSTECHRLDTGHPAMADFLKKIYAHCVNAAQVWLYKEQQALRSINLKPFTVDLGRAAGRAHVKLRS